MYLCIEYWLCYHKFPETQSEPRPYRIQIMNHRDWLLKFATGLNMIIGCSSKSIWLTRLLFCQNGSPMRGSFWQKNSFITHILLELQPIIIFSPVANFGNQSIILLFLLLNVVSIMKQSFLIKPGDYLENFIV